MIDKKWLEDYKLKAESCLELYTENATIKNLAKIILILVKEIEILPVEAGVSDDFCDTIFSLDDYVKKYFPDSEIVIVKKEHLEKVEKYIAELTGGWQYISKNSR
jgi:hypothetical protein